MLKNLLSHEIKVLFKSRRVVWSVSIFLILYALIFTLRVKDFNVRQQNYISDIEQVKAENDNITNYSFLGTGVIKQPKLASIFHEGHTHTFGTFIKVMLFDHINGASENSTSSNPVYVFPTRMDITYLITFFLSLFVLLISFDTVNGEKEAGMLRMLFVYPIKRIHFVMKKVIGNLLFVALVFGIPFVLSCIYLLIASGNLFDTEFLQFVIVYFIYTLIYLFLISLIGIFFSVITKSSARSLIFILTFWISFSIIIPIAYDYFSKYLDHPDKRSALVEEMNELWRIRSNHLEEIPEEIHPGHYGHMNWNGGYENCVSVFGAPEMYRAHIEYMRYYNNNIVPNIRKSEQLRLEAMRLTYNHERIEPYLMFFNPNVLFENAVESVSMTSYKDHIEYLSDAISIRDKFIDDGINDGWLFTKNTICTYDTSAVSLTFDEFILDELDSDFIRVNFPKFDSTTKGRQKLLDYIIETYSNNGTSKSIEKTLEEYNLIRFKNINDLKPLELAPVNLPEYSPRKLQIADIIKRTYINLIFMGLSSILLLVIIIQKFKNFDLR